MTDKVCIALEVIGTFTLIIICGIGFAEGYFYKWYVKYLKRTPTSHKGYKVGDRVTLRVRVYGMMGYVFNTRIVKINSFMYRENKDIYGIRFSDNTSEHIDYIILLPPPNKVDHYPSWF